MRSTPRPSNGGAIPSTLHRMSATAIGSGCCGRRQATHGPPFQEQVLTLAVWLVDHLRASTLDAAGAPAKDGAINRTAALCAQLRGVTEEEAKNGLAGLYAVYNIRSHVAAHRTGDQARRTLERAGIAEDGLRAGFGRLAGLAKDALLYLRDSLRAAALSGG